MTQIQQYSQTLFPSSDLFSPLIHEIQPNVTLNNFALKKKFASFLLQSEVHKLKLTLDYFKIDS